MRVFWLFQKSPPSWICRFFSTFILEIVPVELQKFFLGNKVDIQRPSRTYNGTDLEMPCDCLIWICTITKTTPYHTKITFRDEKLCSHGIAKSFGVVRCWLKVRKIRYAFLTNKNVGEFVSKGEHLRRLVIGVVYEDEGSILVHKRKTAKFFGVQRAMGVVPHNSVYNHHNARVFDIVLESSKRVRPGCTPCGPVMS